MLQSAPYVYPNITEVSLPYWNWQILVKDYFDMLISESCYITTISYYHTYRLGRMASKLEEAWAQIPFWKYEQTGFADITIP